MLCLKHSKLILVFPGMGKTPLSLDYPKYRDIDFGTFRKGLGYSKVEDRKLCPIFVQYLLALDEDLKGHHCIIMSNEPMLMEFIKVNRVYLPCGESLRYCFNKLHVSYELGCKWINAWAAKAKRYHVPVTWLNVGFDDYIDEINTIRNTDN